MYKPTGAHVINIAWLNDVEILIITDRKVLKKYIKLNDLDKQDYMDAWDDNYGACRTFHHKGYRYYVLLIRDHRYSTLCHEADHMADFILYYKDIPLNIKNVEVRAYMTDFIFKGLLDVFGLKDEFKPVKRKKK